VSGESWLLAESSDREATEERERRYRRIKDRSTGLWCEAQGGSYAVSRVNVAVAVADEAQGSIYEVAAACRALGLDHTATLAMVGVLTGSMESNQLAKLLAVPGVLAVEVECRAALEANGTSRCRAHLN